MLNSTLVFEHRRNIMKPEIFLLVVLLISLTAVFLYIRNRVIDSKIQKHSTKIELILKLNKSISFHNLEKKYGYQKAL